MKKIVTAALLVLLIFVCLNASASTFTCVVRRGEWVWLRDAPSKDANKIGTIRYGMTVNISSIVDGYAHIQFQGKDGWADLFYFEKPIKEEIYLITSDGPVNKRETPEGRFMQKIKSGQRISVLGWRYSHKGELWAKVWHGGYVKAIYLTKIEE